MNGPAMWGVVKLPCRVLKALGYVTHSDRLLVFRQVGRPEQGVQVPGGSVERGESLADAALREVREETGLMHVRVRRYLGSRRYELKVDRGPPHLRHFFELTCDGAVAERWQHPGSLDAALRPILFDFWWEPLATARLDWEMDACLSTLIDCNPIAPHGRHAAPSEVT